MQIDVGIAQDARTAIAQGLARLLADSYTLMLKTQNYHWNVTGPMFQSLHLMFEGHYTELQTAVDEVAERIRSLGLFAPAGYKAFGALTSIAEDEAVPGALDMVANLVKAHEAVIKTARGLLPRADEAGDQVTADLLTRRLQIHEKTAWMLRSLLEG
ncbi:MAG: DNA starvation/stationary phase protection protein [Myxococcales bacterium]|nr:DNA starvation/stationary phase protection protein [Myxococcales bacterium]